MFNGCGNLTGGQGTTIAMMNSSDATYARADGGVDAPDPNIYYRTSLNLSTGGTLIIWKPVTVSISAETMALLHKKLKEICAIGAIKYLLLRFM